MEVVNENHYQLEVKPENPDSLKKVLQKMDCQNLWEAIEKKLKEKKQEQWWQK